MYNYVGIYIYKDHGMTEVLNETILIKNTSNFDLYNDKDNFIIDFIGANLGIKLTDKSNYTINELMELIVNNTESRNMYEVWNKDNIPFEYKESYNNRIPDIIMAGYLGHLFEFENVPKLNQSWLTQKGTHGFNNSEFDMNGIFLGIGPSFKKNYQKNSTRNLNVYELMCQVLCGLIPSANNGSLDEIKDILQVTYQ